MIFQKQIAKFILSNYFVVPKEPVQFTQSIQGPLTQNKIIEYTRNKIYELFPDVDKELVLTFSEPDPFTGISQTCRVAFSLQDWDDKDMSLETYLDSQLKERQERNLGIEGLYGHNSEATLMELLHFNGSAVKSKGANQYPDEKPENLIEQMSSREYNGHWIRHSSYATRSNPEVLLKSIEKSGYGWPIIDMSEKIQLDVEMAKAVMRNNPTDICYLRPEMMDNLEVMEETVKHEKYANCIHYASARAKNEPRLAMIGLYFKEGEKTEFRAFGKQIRDDDMFFLMAYINEGTGAFYSASERLKQKYWFLKELI